MSYKPTVWQSGDVITATKLNKLENGLEAAVEVYVGSSEPKNGEGIWINPFEDVPIVNSDNHLYEGINLTQRFADEIALHNDDSWAWIKARILAKNYAGINVCDYIPFTVTVGNTAYDYHAQIAGINTYTGYGDSYAAVGNHIDFITKELWPTAHAINKVRYNNGMAAEAAPWLVSDMYHWLNSKSGTIPSVTTYGGGGENVNYSASGVYYYLPQALKNVIVEKTLALETRYTTTEQSVLTGSNGYEWAGIGKLWLPTELEVTGTLGRGAKGYSTMGSIQYPLFANSYMGRRKVLANTADTRASWWTLTPSGDAAGCWCYMHTTGFAQNYYAETTSYRVPICFRVA